MNKIEKCMFTILRIALPLASLLIIPITPFFLLQTEWTELILEILLNNEKKIELATSILTKVNLNISFLVSVLLFIILVNFFQKRNETKIFNSNGKIYYDYWYVIFWLSAKILGYGKVQLTGIPIAMQHKLVLRSTFESIMADMWENHYDEIPYSEEPQVKLTETRMDLQSKYINLIIADTFDIKEEQLAVTYRNNPTIKVCSPVISTQRRYKNIELVQQVRESLERCMNSEHDVIFIFSTANPLNNLNIITSSFRRFGRFQDKKIYVVQLNQNTKEYTKAYRII